MEDVERAARLERLLGVSKRRAQELAELRVLHRVVLDRLPVRAVVVHVVRRIGEPEVCFVLATRFGDILRLGRVAAYEEVLSEDVHLAGLRDGDLRHVRGGVRLRLAVRADLAAKQFVELVVVESKHGEVEPRLLQGGEFDLQLVLVPLRDLCDLVVGDAERLLLLGREVGGDDARHRLPAELLHREQSRVAFDDDLVLVEDGGVPKAELLDDLGELLDRALVDAGVVLVGDDLAERDVHDLHSIPFHSVSPYRVSESSGISSGRSSPPSRCPEPCTSACRDTPPPASRDAG